MTVRHAVALVSVILLTSVAVGAADDRQASGTAAATVTGASPALFEHGAEKNPYGKLFTGSTAEAQRRPIGRQLEVARPEKPKVVCGMLVLPADASIDSRMRMSPPASDNTKHTMRVVKPPLCTSE